MGAVEGSILSAASCVTGPVGAVSVSLSVHRGWILKTNSRGQRFWSQWPFIASLCNEFSYRS